MAMPIYALLAVSLAALTTGFLTGLLLFKAKQHWCPECGGQLRCVQCLYQAGRLPGIPTTIPGGGV
jgi:hypothetical protein